MCGVQSVLRFLWCLLKIKRGVDILGENAAGWFNTIWGNQLYYDT